MSLFVNQIITAPEHLPVTVAAADETLTAAIVDELERTILFRGIVHQTRRILIDGDLPPRIEIEPTTSISEPDPVDTPDDDAEVIDPDDYMYVSRDPQGTIIAPHDRNGWPAAERAIGTPTRSPTSAAGRSPPKLRRLMPVTQ